MEKILELRNITKTFPGVKALDCVHLNVYRGKVMGLLGENGAGKSTLMKVLSGVYRPDSGSVSWGGKDVPLTGLNTARRANISFIHQELSLLPNLSIAENIFLNKLPVTKLGRVQWKQIYNQTEEFLELVQVRRDPHILVGELSISEQQLVEIAKSLVRKSQLIIMDEPTDSLTDEEVQNLFSIIADLKNSGKSIIYITHRLGEVFQICDDVTILRDGAFICEAASASMDEEQLIKAMVGRKLQDQFPRLTIGKPEPVLELKGVSNNKVKNIHLKINSGEVLGLLGLMGAGRTELGKTIYGYYPVKSGDILHKGHKLDLKSPKSGVQNKIAYVSEDRKKDGLITKISVRENMVLSSLNKLENTCRQIIKRKEKKYVDDYVKNFCIKTSDINQKVAMLSGGNQQKISIARALMSDPEILILDEPTRGIDVGAKKEIYDLINQLKEKGLAVVLISSEMPEILGLSDRIAVMCDKRITGVFLTQEANPEQLLKYATEF